MKRIMNVIGIDRTYITGDKETERPDGIPADEFCNRHILFSNVSRFFDGWRREIRINVHLRLFFGCLDPEGVFTPGAPFPAEVVTIAPEKANEHWIPPLLGSYSKDTIFS